MSFSLAFSFLNKQAEGWHLLYSVLWQQMHFCWNVQLWFFFQRLAQRCHCTSLLIKNLIFLNGCVILLIKAGSRPELSVQKVSFALYIFFFFFFFPSIFVSTNEKRNSWKKWKGESEERNNRQGWFELLKSFSGLNQIWVLLFSF